MKKLNDILKVFHNEKKIVKLRLVKWGHIWQINTPNSVHILYGRNFE